jgi:hypothetical protein
MVKHEGRQAHRYAITGERQAATLESEHVQVPVRLLNESATGFLIEVDSSPPFQKGDTVRLHTNTGLEVVEIVYIRTDHGQNVLGIQRIKDVIEGDGISYARPLWRRLSASVCRQMVFLCFQPAVCIVFILLISGVFFLRDQVSMGDRTAHVLFARNPTQQTSKSEVTNLKQELLEGRIRALEMFVSSPERAAVVRLSLAQRDALQRIIEPYLKWHDRENQSFEAKEEAANQAYVDVLEVLSPEQKRRFLRTSQ